MEENFKESVPNEALELNNELLTPIKDQALDSESLGLSGLEIDPPGGKKKGKASTSPTKGKELAPVAISTPKKDILFDIGKDITGTKEIAHKDSINFDFDKYAPYFGSNMGFISDVEAINKHRAGKQTGWEQLKNASTRVLLNVLPEVAAQLGNVADLEDYATSDQEVGNWLSNAMKSLQQDVDEANPIYTRNEDEVLNVGESGWWYKNGANLVTSALGFVGTGYITGGVASSIFTKSGQAATWLSTAGKANQLGHTGKLAVQGVSTVANAVALNQAEGVGIGVDTYNQVYQNTLNAIKADKRSVDMSEEEIESEARQEASEAAASAINFNKVNILLNLTSASMFMKPISSTRALITPPNFKKSLLMTVGEGTQEAIEENINDIAQQQAMQKEYKFKNAMEHVMSEQGLESGLLGFVGGAGQTALIKAGKYLPIYDNKAYKQAYSDAYNKLDINLTEEEKNATANQIAIEKVGTNKNRVSANFLKSQKYVEQQNLLNRYDSMSNAEKIGDISSAFYNAKEQSELQEDIQRAYTDNNIGKATELENKLFNIQAKQAFETGTTKGFIDIYKGYADLTKEEATEKGIYTEGDELTSEYYKTKAEALVKKAKDLEQIYIQSSNYINNYQVYDLEEQKYNTNESLTANSKKISDTFTKAEELYKNNDRLNPGKNKNYIDPESKSGYDINKVTPAFKKTPIYRQLHSLLKADGILRETVNTLQSTLDEVTTYSFQNQLQDLIKNNRKKNQKEVKAKELKKVRSQKVVEETERINKFEEDVKQEEYNKAVETIDVEEGLPVVRDEESVPVSEDLVPNTNKTLIPVSVKFPVFNDANINATLNMVETAVSNPKGNLEQTTKNVKDLLDRYKENKDAILQMYPLEATNMEDTISTLEDLYNTLLVQNSTQEEAINTIQDMQRDLVGDLLEDTAINNIEENASPAIKPDFQKNRDRFDKLSSILDKMFDAGIDTSNFKTVVLSFEEATSKEEVLKVFNPLKQLFNLVTDSNVEGGYDDIMLSIEEKKNIVGRHKKIALYSTDKDTYTTANDNISQDVLTLYDNLAKLNGVNTAKSGFAFDTYNETGANLLAYLARRYNTSFIPKISKSGKPYIEVSKDDIDNLVNSLVDDRVLDPDFIKTGQELRFIPLASVTLEDGTILNAEDTNIDNAPIGIEIDGELIEGLYLHDVSWLNKTNLNNTTEAIIADQNRLRNFRALVLNSPVPIVTKVINRSPGVPILDSSDEVKTVLEQTPNVEIGIIKDGKVYKHRNLVQDVSNLSSISEGKGVIIIPFGAKKLALPVKRTKLEQDQITSITEAIRLHLGGKQTDVTNELENLYGFNLLKQSELERYINQFINLNNYSISSIEDFTDVLNGLANETIPVIQFSKGVLYFGYGLGLDVGQISKEYSGENLNKALDNFSTFLKGNYSHINLDLLKENKAIPFISDNSIIKPYDDYITYAKANMISPYMSLTLESGKEVYTIQSKLHYDIETPFKNILVDDNIEATVDPDTSTVTIKETSNDLINQDILLPNGQTFNFNNVLDTDFSPAIDDTNRLNDELLLSSFLIKGISIPMQIAVVKSIANDIAVELIANKDVKEYSLLLRDNINLSMQGFELIKDRAQQIAETNSAFADKANLISNQVDILLDNTKKITQAVVKELAKRQNISAIETIADENDELSVESDEQSERETGYDTTQFTIDPRTKLTGEVKNFLSNVVDRKEVAQSSNPSTIVFNGKNYAPIINFLNLNSYIGFDVIYNDLLSILSKHNGQPQHIDKSLDLDEKFGIDTPSYVKHMLYAIEKEVENKPYLLDVLVKLKNSEPHIQNGFYLAFNKTHTNHIFLGVTYNADEKSLSIKTNKASTRNVSGLILSEWQNNLRYSGILDTSKEKIEINKDVINTFKSLYSDLQSKDTNITYEGLNNWLNIIGIDIPLKLFNVLDTQGFKTEDNFQTLKESFTLSNGIFKNIHDRVIKFEPDTAGQLDLKDGHLFEDSSFKNLAYLIGKFKNNLFTNSFKNGNGDTIYGETNSRYVTERILELKSNLNKLVELKNDIFSSTSTWLNDILIEDNGVFKINTESSVYKQLEYSTSDSIKINKNKTGKTIDKLKPSELEKYNLGLFYNEGQYIGKKANPQPISRFLYPTMSDKATTVAIKVPSRNFKLTSNGTVSDSDINYLVETLLYPEIDRIKAFQSNPNFINIKEYQQGANKFLLFPELNNVVELYEEDGKLKEEVGKSTESNEILKGVLKGYLSNLLSNRLETWRKHNLIRINKNTKAEELLFIDKTYAKVFDINKNSIIGIRQVAINYELNSLIANMNFQQLYIGDPALYFKKDIFGTADNIGKRLSASNAGKDQYPSEVDETFNYLVVKDNPVTSTAIDYIQKLYKNDLEAVEAYLNINSTDAQEFTTLSEHLKLMFKRGEISKNKMDNVIRIYDSTGKISKSNLETVLGATKPVYTNSFTRDGINSFLYVKTSSIPLIKEFTAGTPLDTLRTHMENSTNGIDRVVFESGVKVGLPAKVVNIFTEEGDIVIPDNWRTSLITNVPRQGHGEQQANPYDEDKNTVNDGTQQSKELFTNFLDIDGFVSPITNQVVKGRELAQEYLNVYQKSFKLKQNKLIRSLGYDAETGTITNMKKLVRMLKDEGISRNYSSNDLAALELNETETKFAIPLWLNGADSKIVALLNSIVDNKIRKRKFRGKSFVLASPAGVNIQDQSKSGIVSIGDWDGQLKAGYNSEGKMESAEVLIPFKFWDNTGKALSIEQFLKPDGTIDNALLPKELLEMFGYRIPTSGTNLMSNIKVVGFLPSSYGDIVIAPSDFIVQMGSDFDVDKLYTHMYNTYYNPITKELLPINENLVNQYVEVRNSLGSLNRDLKNTELTEEQKLGLTNQRDLIKDLEILKLTDIEEMLYQNQLLDIHKAVFNNPNEEVQRARVKPIAFGDLPDLVKKLYKADDNKFFTLLSNAYQQFKYLNARAGKTAVGIFSLDMVFNSVIQLVEEPMVFLDTKTDSESGATIVKEISYNIAGQKSTILNSIKTIDGSKYKSDVIEAFMSSALDNEKEQILGKLNINNHTFDFIRAMSQLGYTEEITISIINQPIIKTYIESVEANKAELAEPFNIEYKGIISSTTIEALQNEILQEFKGTTLQKAVLSLFHEMTSKGKQLKVVQSTINSDSSGIGKNLFYSLKKAEQILSLPSMNSSISNAEKVVGDYINISYVTQSMSKTDRKTYVKEKIKEGYTQIKDTLIKPNSIGGFASVYGTVFNNELWNSFYPYTDTSFTSIISAPLEGNLNRGIGLSQEAKEKQEFTNTYKSMLNSGSFNFTGEYNTIEEARKDLLFDTETHSSLGSIIQDIKNKETYKNLLLNRLQIGRANTTIDLEGKVPTNISYYNAMTLEMDAESLTDTMIDMIVNDTPIGEYNGKLLTSKDLANKMIIHQLITGGVQKSNQFIKYIPFKYLQQVGYYNNMEEVSNTMGVVGATKVLKDRFKTQYIQHNPEEYYDETLEQFISNIDKGVLKLTKDLDNNIIITKTENENFRIFKKNEVGTYIEIDKLGLSGILEYNMFAEFAGKSNIWINQGEQLEERFDSVVPLVPANAYIPTPFETKEFLNLDTEKDRIDIARPYNLKGLDLNNKYLLNDNSLAIEDKYKVILDTIKNNSSNPILSYFAEQLNDISSYLAETPIYVDTKLKQQAVTYTSNLLKQPLQIRINPNLINSEEELQEVLIEEMVHGVLKKELQKTDSETRTKLENLRLEIKEQLSNKYGKEAIESMEQKVKNRLPLVEGIERDLLYPIANLDEFVAASIKNKKFQEYLNSSEGTHTTKSLWQKLLKIITDLLNRLGVKKDSNLEAVLHETLNLFDNVKNVSTDIISPKYNRTIEYLNEKFNLIDSNSNTLTKGNGQQIADFINSNIVNVIAKNVNGKVFLESKAVKDFTMDFSLGYELPDAFSESSIASNLVNYNYSLELRLKDLKSSLRTARQNNDYSRIAKLEEELHIQKENYNRLSEVESVVALSTKAQEDLEHVNAILNRTMSADDLVYTRNIINFWSKAKEMVLDDRLLQSENLRSIYGDIEGLAKIQGDKLLLIEKTYLQEFVKQYHNKEVSLDEVFNKYKDINFLQANVRDISNYDNILLNTIWTSVKTANINATDEANKKLEVLDTQLKSVIPILKGTGNKEIFDTFRQKTSKGYLTGHLVQPYSPEFYQDKAKYISTLIEDSSIASMNKYTNWLEENTINVELETVFPVDEVITPEVNTAREALKVKLGVAIYNEWFRKQSNKIENYRNNKNGYLNHLLAKYNLENLEELSNHQDAMANYDYWTENNSPYKLEKVVHTKAKFGTKKGLQNHRYYEAVPKNPAYLDSNFDTIANNSILLDFYTNINNLFEELNKYVPEAQQKDLMYGGIPFVEKTLIEMYAEKGLELGYTPINDAFIKSMQTSFSGSGMTLVDPSSNKPIKERHIPIIKNSYNEIQNLIEKARIAYFVEHKKDPSIATLELFKEQAIDSIAQKKSFDLGKVAKIYTTLVLGHKHKSAIEDQIKVANTVLDTYEENYYKPDGTLMTNAITGAVQKKDASKSFIKTKEALEYFTDNVIYGNIKEEEGKGKQILTKTEKEMKREIVNQKEQLKVALSLNQIDQDQYNSTISSLDEQDKMLGKTMIVSKVGDNILKYIQIKLMGWNVLGGISNMSFGFIANIIEGAGGQIFTQKDLMGAYKLATNSILKNATFNQVNNDMANKIRSGMDKMDILKDASQELYTSTTPNSFNKKLKTLAPFNANQRTEYLNQAPLMIALFKKTKTTTDKGEVSLWDGYDKDWNWKPEFGIEPKELITKTRIKLDQLIKRTHGNYDTLSPLQLKKHFLGRAGSQFRTWLFESVATRIEEERFDANLDTMVKGRYRSVGTVFGQTKLPVFGLELAKGVLKSLSFGLISNAKGFEGLIDGENVKDIDAANMRKVCMEIALAIDVYLFLLLMGMIMGDDDDKDGAMNILFNQGTRLKTDLLLYVNPMEARNLIRDIIPATMIIKDSVDWFSSVGNVLTGTDEYETGVHSGESKFLNSTAKMIPFTSKVYSTYNSASQVFDK